MRITKRRKTEPVIWMVVRFVWTVCVTMSLCTIASTEMGKQKVKKQMEKEE